MGHLIFLLLHLIAFLFFALALLFTIPLHLIYSAASTRKPDPNAPTPRTHMRCPECKEFVRYEATICKSCHAKLVPQEPPGFFKDLFTRHLD